MTIPPLVRMINDRVPSHTVTSRPATDTEQARINQEARPSIPIYGCLVFCAGIIPAVGFGFLATWIGGLVGPRGAQWGRWIGGVIGVVTLTYALISFSRFDRRMRARARGDVEAQTVEELSVSNPRVIQISLINDNEPIVVFDIGGGKLLFLQGQWLYDPHTYGGQHCDDDGDEFLNALPAPYSFPSTEFTISRMPNSGLVFGIAVKGSYLNPEKKVDVLKTEYEFGDSEVFTGDLEHIADVLATEHARRFAAASIRAQVASTREVRSL